MYWARHGLTHTQPVMLRSESLGQYPTKYEKDVTLFMFQPEMLRLVRLSM